MNMVKKVSEGILLGGIVFLLFMAGFQQLIHLPAWLKVAGRMHPMFLHFPIVLLLLSFASVWIPRSEQARLTWLGGFRLLAALSAVITAIMGLMLSMEEDRSGGTLQWHKWSGIGLALLGTVFYSLHGWMEKHITSARSLTLVSTFVIILTGHWGASLTHGRDYLLAPIASERKIPVTEAVVFNDVIRPLLASKCLSCHSEDNIKGGLSMQNVKGMLAGGKTGPLFVPGDPMASLLIRRIHLAETDRKHMPPRARPQLSEEETVLLSAWVKSGALLDRKLTSLPVQDSFRMLASHALGASENADQPIYSFTAASEDKVASLNSNFRVLEKLGEGSPAISVHFYGREKYSSKSLEELLSVKDQVIELTLSRMPVKDQDLAFINKMPNLQRLNLNYTDITNAGMEQITGLKNLQMLTISGTSVDKAALDKLLTLPLLHSVFAWNTRIDSTTAAAIHQRYPKITVETGYKDNEGLVVPLSPPLFSVPAGVLEEPLKLVIRHPFQGVDIRYTLDGSTPDSATSLRYKDPILLSGNMTLVARSFKPGWLGSTEVRASYIKKGFEVDSVQLLTKVDPRFRGVKSSALFDADLGELNVNNGQWLGFKESDATFLLYFKDTVTVQNLLLNMLQNTRALIFLPVKIEVWGGMSSDQLSLVASSQPPVPEKQEPSSLKLQTVALNGARMKVMKIVAYHLGKVPGWHEKKGKPASVFISEIVAN